MHIFRFILLLFIFALDFSSETIFGVHKEVCPTGFKVTFWLLLILDCWLREFSLIPNCYKSLWLQCQSKPKMLLYVLQNLPLLLGKTIGWMVSSWFHVHSFAGFLIKTLVTANSMNTVVPLSVYKKFMHFWK